MMGREGTVFWWSVFSDACGSLLVVAMFGTGRGCGEDIYVGESRENRGYMVSSTRVATVLPMGRTVESFKRLDSSVLLP